ncbi:MAG: DUF1598 domain-containing protein [Planctomycetaceae bacterium]|jgi:hypothetical protein|nr:DUF1598 domain-containing protein [Planctomycetaceae bacterium]
MKFTNSFIFCAVLFAGLVFLSPIFGQSNNNNNSNRNNNGNNNNGGGWYGGSSVVGGVEVDANGILKTAESAKMKAVGESLAKLLEQVPADLKEKASVRKVSLKKIDAQMQDIIAKNGEFPDALRYLGGLTAIRYIVVVPEENDVLLVGPAEGWKVDAFSNVVGTSSGRPVLRLEDLLTVFRAWSHTERPSVITCSIDPTQDALAKIAQVEKQFAYATAANAQAKANAYEQAYGLNTVTVNGVPANSRFAKVLVACDYKMKRFGLGLESSNVRGLPSYTSLINGSQSQRTPRFWLAPEYGTVSYDSQKNVWQLSEVKVKALTDDEYIDSRSNSRQSSGKVDKAAMNWCGKMNAHYDALCKVDPVFGDLKNCMELAIAAALIQREGLLEKADCKLPTFAENSQAKPVSYPVPKNVPSQSVISRAGQSIIIACGGVEINPFVPVQNAKLDSALDKSAKDLAKTDGKAWWSK